VQVQLEAYNARHLDRFTAVCRRDQVFARRRKLLRSGKAAFAEYYRPNASPRRTPCRGAKRIVMGNNHRSRTHFGARVGIRGRGVTVVDGLIQTVWFAPD
jgi:hypothetical protein